MFVTTVPNLDDYPDIKAVTIDSQSFEAAITQAAHRAAHLAPGEMAYVKFTKPPTYRKKITEVVTFTGCLEWAMNMSSANIDGRLITNAKEAIAQMPKYDDAKIDFANIWVKPIGTPEIITPGELEPAFNLVIVEPLDDESSSKKIGSRVKHFSTMDDAIAFMKNHPERVFRMPHREPSIWCGWRIVGDTSTDLTEPMNSYPISMRHDTYEVHVPLKMPLEESNDTYIVFGG